MATINSIDTNIPIEISNGGTNTTNMSVSYAPIYYDGTKLVTTSSVGVSGQVLTSNAAAAPTFQNSSSTTAIGFYANLSADTAYNLTGDETTVTIPINAERFDLNGDYDTATYTFTVPTTGYYMFTSTIIFAVTASNTDTATNTGYWQRLRKVGTSAGTNGSHTGKPEPIDGTTPSTIGNAGDGLWGLNASLFLKLIAADTFYVRADYTNSSLGKTTGFEAATNGSRTFFCGYLAGV